VASRRKIYDRSQGRLDSVLELVHFAARPMPLVSLLDEAPRRIAAILGADVCSIYVLEGEGTLVLRGNIGFPNSVLGQVRLAIGEGITGEAVEYMRPISAELAEEHASYKHFENTGEGKYPVFLAAPIRGKSGPLGAVVVQRKEGAFSDSDVEVLVLCGALIAAGIRTAELIDHARDHGRRGAGGGTRKVTLPGLPIVPGRALGAIAAVRRPALRPSERHISTKADMQHDIGLLRGAFDTADKALGALRARAKDSSGGAQFLGTYIEILSDARMRELAIEHVKGGASIPDALGRVAREATRTAASISRDSFLEERARDVEDLCAALAMLAEGDKRADLPTKAVLIGDGLTVFDLLVSARAQPVGIALSDRAQSPRTRTLLELMAVPAIVDVRGLFRWATDGDLALIDADHGLLVLNPSKSEIASIRESRREDFVRSPRSRAGEEDKAE
jgi:phosphotransferase system enzyme I (PtsP)